jgi:hypothetical protein
MVIERFKAGMAPGVYQGFAYAGECARRALLCVDSWMEIDFGRCIRSKQNLPKKLISWMIKSKNHNRFAQ